MDADKNALLKDAANALNRLTVCDTAPVAVREVNSSSTLTRDNSTLEPIEPIETNRNPTTFSDLVKSVSTASLPLGWALIKTDGETIKIGYVQERKHDCTENSVISKSIIVNSNGSWSLRVLDRVVTKFDSPGCARLKKFQNLRTKDELLELVNVVDSSTICCGNPDIDVQTGNQTAISRETRFEVKKQDGSIYNSTIRSDKCLLLTSEKDRCHECVKQRNYLRVMKSRQAKANTNQRTAVDSHVNYRYLSSEEKDTKIKKLHIELKATKRSLNRVQSKVQETIEKEGHVLDDEMNNFLKEILTSGKNLEELPIGTFRR